MCGAGARCFLLRLTLLQAKSDIGQFQKPRATGIANMAMVPGALAVATFQAETWSDPEVPGKINVIALLGHCGPEIISQSC